MMPAAQTQRFAHVLGTDDAQLGLVPRAGHLAHTDNPNFVADAALPAGRHPARWNRLPGGGSPRSFPHRSAL